MEQVFTFPAFVGAVIIDLHTVFSPFLLSLLARERVVRVGAAV